MLAGTVGIGPNVFLYWNFKRFLIGYHHTALYFGFFCIGLGHVRRD